MSDESKYEKNVTSQNVHVVTSLRAVCNGVQVVSFSSSASVSASVRFLGSFIMLSLGECPLTAITCALLH